VSDADGAGGASGLGLGDFAGSIGEVLDSDDNNLGGILGKIDEVLGTASDALGGGGGLVGDIIGEAADKVEDATGIPLDEVKSLGKLASGLKGLDGLDDDISGLFSGGGGGSSGGLGDLGDLSHEAAQAQNEVLQGAALVMKLASGAVAPMGKAVDSLADLSSEALDLIGLGEFSGKIKDTAKALKDNDFDPFDSLYDAAHGK
jgi:hypothetical protein